jgi:hypothetical protein
MTLERENDVEESRAEGGGQRVERGVCVQGSKVRGED